MDAAAHAVARFGLGRRAGEALPADPRGWLMGQLEGGDGAVFTGLPDTAGALALYREDQALRKADPAAAAAQRIAPTALHVEQEAAMAEALSSAAPFRERLVWFWSNHFTVSTLRGVDATLVGPFVREAIRPHVTGTFTEMLLAVMRHPAMLLYLDNANSVGPNSRAGLRRHQGLNENLARESLELHTITPAGGYSQADVTDYARILTGWSVAMEGAGFVFRPETHEPGPGRLLGRVFAEGEEGGVAALRFLAAHPATIHALAVKLARHFIADAPPPDAVARIAFRLEETRGDLGAAAAAIVEEPAAWRPLTKLRSPLDYTLAVLRAAGPRAGDAKAVIGALYNLGQPVWAAPLPNGWPDRAADWADPETLLRRADWAYRVCGRLANRDPEEVAGIALGGLLQPATRAAMRNAASRREASTLMFTSPECMRR